MIFTDNDLTEIITAFLRNENSVYKY
jgi:hypothetical protein